MERSLTRPSLSSSKTDARWLQWVAKGHAHDMRVRDGMRVAALSIASLVALGLAITLAIR